MILAHLAQIKAPQNFGEALALLVVKNSSKLSPSAI